MYRLLNDIIVGIKYWEELSHYVFSVTARTLAALPVKSMRSYGRVDV